MVGMSATVGNINELAEFLGAETYENNFRPVHLIKYAMVGRVILRCQHEFEGNPTMRSI